MVIKSLRAFGWLTGLLLIALGISRMAFSLDSMRRPQLRLSYVEPR
ncbi:hypothetical protein [Mycobacterium sp. UM_Kg27]|nr:hypothetical protein [Mycobacterium sp. UM_Kg27]